MNKRYEQLITITICFFVIALTFKMLFTPDAMKNVKVPWIPDNTEEKVVYEDYSSRYKYLLNYVNNETWFGSNMAYYGDENLRHYYTFDRIWMSEDEYVKYIWLDILKWYNDSEIFVDNYGFNKSQLNIVNVTVERYNKEKIEHYWKENGTWFIAETVVDVITECGNLIPGGTYFATSHGKWYPFTNESYIFILQHAIWSLNNTDGGSVYEETIPLMGDK